MQLHVDTFLIPIHVQLLFSFVLRYLWKIQNKFDLMRILVKKSSSKNLKYLELGMCTNMNDKMLYLESLTHKTNLYSDIGICTQRWLINPAIEFKL